MFVVMKTLNQLFRRTDLPVDDIADEMIRIVEEEKRRKNQWIKLTLVLIGAFAGSSIAFLLAYLIN